MMTKREIRRRIKLYKELIKFCQRSKINECKKSYQYLVLEAENRKSVGITFG
jgi:hypothetical protein